MERSIRVLARAVILREGRLLLARLKGATYTHLPGGRVEPGEPVARALERELREELGVEGRVGDYVGAVEHAWEEKGELRHEINHVFDVATSLDPSVSPRSREPDLEFLWSLPAAWEGHDLRPPALLPLLRRRTVGDGSIGWASTMRP